MKLTIPHRYDFGRDAEVVGDNLLSSAAWDRLRLEATNLSFVLAADRPTWLERCKQSKDTAIRAKEIGEIIAAKQFCAVFSVGVGCACLEYHLKARLPAIRLICTEFSLRVLQRLSAVFLEADQVIFFDMTSPQWPNFKDKTLYLLNRVDTDLSDPQWKQVFENMARSRIDHVMVVATGFVTLKTLAWEVLLHCRGLWRRRPAAFAGYLRTKEMFKSMWLPHYELEMERSIGGLASFLLRRVE